MQTISKECAREADRDPSPDNICKVGDILIQVFVVQWGHDDILHGRIIQPNQKLNCTAAGVVGGSHYEHVGLLIHR